MSNKIYPCTNYVYFDENLAKVSNKTHNNPRLFSTYFDDEDVTHEDINSSEFHALLKSYRNSRKELQKFLKKSNRKLRYSI